MRPGAETKRYEGDLETVRITAWAYATYCMVLTPAFVLSAPDTGATRPSAVAVLTISALFSVGILSVLRGRRLGYHCCYVLSILILPAVPIGTVMAGTR